VVWFGDILGLPRQFINLQEGTKVSRTAMQRPKTIYRHHRLLVNPSTKYGF